MKGLETASVSGEPSSAIRSVSVLGVGTAVPEHRLVQADAQAFATSIFAGAFRDLGRLLPVFENALIAERRISCPLEWYGSPHSFEGSNAIYQKVALDLSVRAAERALQNSGVSAAEIARVVFVSTTGIATPSLDAALIQRLGCGPDTARLPVWGLGCAGGVAGLAHSAQLQRAADGPLLLVAVELCSLTFQHGDRSKSNLIAVSLFGDGAAALVLDSVGRGSARSGTPTPQNVGTSTDGFELLAAHSHLFDDSDDIMGWELTPGGLKVRFSRDIPTLVAESLPDLVAAACEKWGVQASELRQVVLHPGGAKVLEAYANSLKLPQEALMPAYEVLRQYGNLSSASVLFVLQEFLRSCPPTGELGLMAALGPGFSAELLLFRW